MYNKYRYIKNCSKRYMRNMWMTVKKRMTRRNTASFSDISSLGASICSHIRTKSSWLCEYIGARRLPQESVAWRRDANRKPRHDGVYTAERYIKQSGLSWTPARNRQTKDCSQVGTVYPATVDVEQEWQIGLYKTRLNRAHVKVLQETFVVKRGQRSWVFVKFLSKVAFHVISRYRYVYFVLFSGALGNMAPFAPLGSSYARLHSQLQY